MVSGAAAASCSSTIFLSSTPWLLLFLVGAFFWARRERETQKRIAALEARHLAEVEELVGLHDLHTSNIEKIHEKDLYILRNAKNLVWLRVSDKGEVYECPGCGFRKPGAAAQN